MRLKKSKLAMSLLRRAAVYGGWRNLQQEVFRKLFTPRQMPVGQRQGFANSQDGLLHRPGEPVEDLGRAELLELADGLHLEKVEDLARLVVLLKDQIETSVDGHADAAEPARFAAGRRLLGARRLFSGLAGRFLSGRFLRRRLFHGVRFRRRSFLGGPSSPRLRTGHGGRPWIMAPAKGAAYGKSGHAQFER